MCYILKYKPKFLGFYEINIILENNAIASGCFISRNYSKIEQKLDQVFL